jgi:hypothetical protein
VEKDDKTNSETQSSGESNQNLDDSKDSGQLVVDDLPSPTKMAEDILDFTYNYMEPTVTVTRLLKEAFQSVRPEDEEKLNKLKKASEQQQIVMDNYCQHLCQLYLDDSQMPILAPDDLARYAMSKMDTFQRVPSWVRLKNIFDQETLTKIWQDIQVIRRSNDEYLSRLKSLHMEIYRKAGLTPNYDTAADLDSWKKFRMEMDPFVHSLGRLFSDK